MPEILENNLPKKTREFKTNVALESLGPNYENVNGALAFHLLLDISRNLESIEGELNEEGRAILSRARELKQELQRQFDQTSDIRERGIIDFKFHDNYKKEIADLHRRTRKLFEEGWEI